MNRAPRLLMVSNFFDTHRGGLEIVAGQMARQLAAQGLAVTWLAADTTPPPPDPSLDYVTLGMWNITERRLGAPFPLFGPRGAWRLFRAVRAADAVILHDSVYPSSMATFLATRLMRKPLVVVQHIGDVPFHNPVLRGLMGLANRFIARPILRRAEQVVFISEVVRDFFRSVRFSRPAMLIFNGVDTAVFRPAEGDEKQTARQRFNLRDEARVALFVGRFVEKKGLHLLRRAAALRPDIVWAFAGWGVLEPETWDMPNVRVIRDVSGADLAALYRACDVLVLPSQGEGFPLVIQEALACGLPVVCGLESARADVAAAAHLIGVDVAAPDVGAVADAVARAVDRAIAGADPSDARTRADFAVQRYAWTANARKYIDILRSLKIAIP